jgi:lysozyme
MDMAFNMGVDGVAGFKKMIAAIKAKNFTTAGKEVLNSDYAKDVGDRAHRIARMISLGVDNGSS